MNLKLETKAIKTLKLFEPPEERSPDGYYIGYSGGKDSEVILALAKLAGVRFHAGHNHTTVDAPETVYHIRKKMSDPENRLTVDYPSITMWDLIVKKMMPPTRLVRYCCRVLKEHGGMGELCVMGVRWDESANRRESSDIVKLLGKPKDTQKKAKELDVDFWSTDKGGVVLNTENDASRRLVEQCYRTRKALVNPIIDWTDKDVWSFIRYYGIDYNPLYDEGYKRVGCVGCPLGGSCSMKREFARYPKYKENYIRAFDRMIAHRAEKGLETVWHDGEECFGWWIQEDPVQKAQIPIDMSILDGWEND